MIKKWIVLVSICTVFVISFIACNSKGGGSDTAPSVQTLTGKFVDSPVANLGYRTATQSGRTNANGEFLYLVGETVTFFIGAIELPAVPAASLITPMTLFGASSSSDTRVVNLARLLLTLDTDGNPNNGIVISDTAYSAATSTIDFASSSFDTDVADLVAHGGGSNALIAADTAVTHLLSTTDGTASPLVGSWYDPAGPIDDTSIIVTFIDNSRFMYMEYSNGGKPIPLDSKDGIEYGTYAFTARTMTPSLIADTNGGWGFSNLVGGVDYLITGTTLTVGVNGQSSHPLMKITSSSTNPLVGSWYFTRNDGHTGVLTFINDSLFVYAEYGPNEPASQPGMERGTYTATATSVTFTVTEDTNGGWGMSNLSGIATPISISGNTLTISPSSGGGKVFTKVQSLATNTNTNSTPVYANQLPLYDDFNSPTIDTTKWFGTAQDAAGTGSLVDGHVQIVSSVTGSIAAYARVRFTSPNTIQAMSADVAVTNYQSSGGSHFARISGLFYNDGTPGSSVGSTVGDIAATIEMTDNAIYYSVYRCLDPNCQTWTYLTAAGGNNHILLADSALGQTHTLFMQWDGSVFVFQVDSNTPVSYDPKPQAPVVSSTPNSPIKFIGIRHIETDGQSGSVTATFDNVRTGASLPIKINAASF